MGDFRVGASLAEAPDPPPVSWHWPIQCLLNVSYKIFTKVATNRISSVADHLVNPTQTAFMHGRNILDGVAIIHETVHELHKKIEWGDIQN